MGTHHQIDKAPGRRIQQREIAAAAGVSISTVSRVLNNVDSVTISRDVKERVWNAAASLGYPVEREQGKPAHINIFINPIAESATRDPFSADILAGIEAECRRQSLHLSHVVVEPGPAGEAFVLSKVKDQSHDGCIFLGMDNRELLEQVRAINYRLVLINADHEELPIDTILPSNDEGARLAVRYLLKHGHRSIVHATDLLRTTIRRRHDAYRATLEASGIRYDPNLVLKIRELGLDNAYESMKAFLMRPHPPFTAVFGANDSTAIGVARALLEAGLRIPQDISIIGFDDISFAAFMNPPLTTIRIEREEMGKLAVRRLLEREAEPALIPIRVEVQSRVIERQSVATISPTQ